MQGEKMSEPTYKELIGKIKWWYYQYRTSTREGCELPIKKLDEYEKALLSRLERGERAIEAMGRIADIVHNYSCHSAKEAYARITEIVM
jgi:hypothetical protein